ncbi:hypothetical protein [Methylobacterium brachythecii]|uniref:Uncharacterized protein n=1 Tax=Methylobacterium brachythecii TaxID=1176177 RepID=A0A7W6AKE0_9HYPH|nr:hypothetical protein [Methylobacterium brachythecii]MBB3902789.1 hypothetical protein [Methylobacterium brachythecii]GLS43714.1 hypothetical protein GCM10007884_16990 [Methylobacterium brachythecii]
MSAAPVTIMIATPKGRHRLVGESDRNVTQPAEQILRALGADVRPAIFWVECEDKTVQSVLTSYLSGVKAEVLAHSRRKGTFQSKGGRGFS